MTRKKCQMSIKVAQKVISLEKLKIYTPLQKLPKNVGDLDKIIVAKGNEKLPKSNKLPNLVTLLQTHFQSLNFCFLNSVLLISSTGNERSLFR